MLNASCGTDPYFTVHNGNIIQNSFQVLYELTNALGNVLLQKKKKYLFMRNYNKTLDVDLL